MADSRLILTIAGLELYLFRDLRAPFPAHLHADPLVGILLSGKRLLQYGTRQRLVKAGEAVALPAFMPHACQPATPAQTDWFCLLLHKTNARNFEPLFTETDPLAGALIKIGTMLAQAQTPSAKEVLGIKDFILSLPPRPSLPAAQRFESLAARLRKQPAENACLAQMAAMAQMDKFRLLRAFRNSNGISPCRYRDNMRLLRAQELLQSGTPLAACASETGYYDQSHFSRRFKATLGVTPGAYQQAWRASLC